MKKYNILLLMLAVLILTIPSIFAEDSVIVNETYTLDVGIISDGGFLSVGGINISIFEPLNRASVVSNQAMTYLSTGQYFYNFIPNETGVYYYVFEISNGTDIVFEGAGTFTSMENIAQNTVWEFDNMLEVFILFAVGILLAVMGEYIGNYLFTLLSGVWFLGNTVQLAFNGQGFTSSIFFALAGLGLIYHGVIKVAEMRETNEKKRIKNITGDEN